MTTLAKHLYIIDDDQSFGRSLKRLLISQGYETHYFTSAKAFLDSVPSGQRGTAIVDLYMPDMDGFALIDRMRELRYDMPVIVVTGRTEIDSRDLAFERGAVGFLQKPFSDRSLMELIESQD